MRQETTANEREIIMPPFLQTKWDRLSQYNINIAYNEGSSSLLTTMSSPGSLPPLRSTISGIATGSIGTARQLTERESQLLNHFIKTWIV